MKNTRFKQSTARLPLLLPVLLLILLVGLAPFLSAFWNSFFHDSYGDRSFAGLDNFRYITRDDGFRYSLNITVLWALLNVFLGLFLGFLLALRLVQPRPSGRGMSADNPKKDSGFLFRMLLIPWGIPVYIAVPLWRAFLHGNGGESVLTRLTGISLNLMIDPAGGFLGALTVSLWMTIPLSAFVFAGHMRKVSRSVIEAARLDGASEGQLALHIYLPEIRESLLAMGVLSFIKAFKEFTLVFLMTAGGPPLVAGITQRHIIGATTTLGVFLYEIFIGTSDWGVNAAYALLTALIVFLIMLLWALVKKQAPTRIFILLSVIAQIPGGSPALWGIAFLYLVSLFRPGIFFRVLVFHAGVLVFRIVSAGFLGGFHPGILFPLVTLMILHRRKRESRPLAPYPLYKWKGLGYLRFIPSRGVPAASRLTAVLFTVFTLLIFYLLIWMSLSRVSAAYMDSFLPPLPTLSNFPALFKEEGIHRYFLNTLIIAGSTALMLPLAVFPGAVWLNGRGKKTTLLFLGFIQILSMAGGIHSLIPLYNLFRPLGLVNSFLPLILIYLYHALPFSLFILTAYLETFPPAFRDTAALEGMSLAGYSFKILLPLSLPPLFAVIMSAFISAWNGFMAPLIFLNDENLYPISMKLYGWVGTLGSGGPVWNLFAAASLLNVLLIGLIFLRFKNPMGTTSLADFPE